VGPRAEILAPTGIRSPDCPARSETLYRLRYPGPLSTMISKKNSFVYPEAEGIGFSATSLSAAPCVFTVNVERTPHLTRINQR
jgi:hypothetical protein